MTWLQEHGFELHYDEWRRGEWVIRKGENRGWWAQHPINRKPSWGSTPEEAIAKLLSVFRIQPTALSERLNQLQNEVTTMLHEISSSPEL